MGPFEVYFTAEANVCDSGFSQWIPSKYCIIKDYWTWISDLESSSSISSSIKNFRFNCSTRKFISFTGWYHRSLISQFYCQVRHSMTESQTTILKVFLKISFWDYQVDSKETNFQNITYRDWNDNLVKIKNQNLKIENFSKTCPGFHQGI